MGVSKFLVNFNTKFLEHERDLQGVINQTLSSFEEYIFYNVGPHGVNTTEADNIHKLQDLVDEHVNVPCDYVIPADSDEFHDYNMTLTQVTHRLETDGKEWVAGTTREHISADGCPKPLVDGVDIFEQFPKVMDEFSMPKISIVRAFKHREVGVGHHGFAQDTQNGENFRSITHHFHWTLDAKKRIEAWIALMSIPEYGGYKNVIGEEKELALYNQCML